MASKNLYNLGKTVSGNLDEFPFIQQQGNTILLSVYIQANANETTIVGLHDDRLKIKIATLPVDGKANKVLCDFIAKQFSVPKKNVTIIKGDTARKKLLKIDFSIS